MRNLTHKEIKSVNGGLGFGLVIKAGKAVVKVVKTMKSHPKSTAAGAAAGGAAGYNESKKD